MLEFKILASALFDTGFLASEVAEVENAGATHNTAFVDLDVSNHRRGEGEDSLHANAAGDLSHGESLGGAGAVDLQDHALELLDTLLGAFHDSIGNGDGVTGFEFGEFLFRNEIVLYVLNQFLFHLFISLYYFSLLFQGCKNTFFSLWITQPNPYFFLNEQIKKQAICIYFIIKLLCIFFNIGFMKKFPTS